MQNNDSFDEGVQSSGAGEISWEENRAEEQQFENNTEEAESYEEETNDDQE